MSDDWDLWMSRGKELGLKDKDLTGFVREQQNIARDERKEKREAESARLEVHEKRETEKELARLEVEKEKLEVEKEKEQTRQSELDLETERVKKERSDGKVSQSNSSGPFHPKLPMFDENKDDIDAFLFRFETHASACGWDKGKWPVYLAALLKGSALSLYHSISGEQTLSWDVLKSHLLRKFQCTEEGFRERFRAVRPEMGESFLAFLTRCRHLLNRWTELSGVSNTAEGLQDLFLREQILQSCTKDLAVFLRERQLGDVAALCEAAELYREAHPNKTLARKSDVSIFSAGVGVADSTGFNNGGSGSRGYRGGRGSSGTGRGQRRGARRGTIKQSDVCRICGGQGHWANQCASSKNFAETFSSAVSEHVLVSEGQPGLHLEMGTINGFSGTILRDTGCTTAGVKRALVRDDQFTGQEQHCRSFGGHIETFPLAEVCHNGS
ncbi:uncharacterized protein [Littorina saxatilis]|uniref:uncharacterized protein n=1 Tax=Littorina saxatilis TaxID=31220 RepID=UPI0038B44137